ncbi:MAG: hypothetical protein ACR2GA_08030, partial [Chloroflexota bacterium]
MLSTLRRSAPLTAILLLAAALRFWGITWGLHNATIERRVHPDEWVVYWLFKWFGAEHNLDPCPAYPHQCFFDWGMAYPYLAYGIHTLLAPLFSLFPAHVAGPQSDPEFVQSVVAGRLTSGCLSVFTVWLAYLLAVRLYSFTGVGLGQQSAVLSHRRGPPTVGPETQRVPRPAPTECAARRIGLVAALIVALSTLLIQIGHFA